ncbi:cytochrome P450/oxidoreductase [Polaromonas sp.]|uniref:cytochrome P450/oxidoreductase n=1 Tax=Polaromonas sp. TaxID=1869339 RepID=UPI003BA95905
MSTDQASTPERGCPFDRTLLTGEQSPTGCPVSKRAAAFDPFEDEYQQDPPDYLRWARDQEPVFYSPRLGYWVVSRYEDIKAIFRDNITFSPSIALEKITPTGPEANAVLDSYKYGMSRTLVNEDEPAHMPRRRLLMDPFTPEELAHHEPMVRQLVREYVDRFIDDGKADLVEQILWEVPLTVALHFLGVPEEDMDTLRKYSIAHTVNTWGRPKVEEQVEVAHAVGNFWQFAGKVLDKMRLDPDASGWMQYGLRKQKEHPDIVTDSYLHSMMMAGIVAAHETTANASANAIKLLLENPQVWQEICADPSLIPNAVEECLRHNGSVAAWRRIATKDAEVGAVKIPAGSKLLIVTSSANHDERHFSDADMVDIRRDNASDHLTFGYGAHQCMGKNLARMEMQIFLEEFTRRLPHMKLSPQRFSYLPNTSFRGPENLLVEWDTAQNPERKDRTLLQARLPVRIGEPSRHSMTRTLLVERVTPVADDVVQLRLADPHGKPLPRWTPGAHIDMECGSPERSRQYSLCGDPEDTSVLEVAVLREALGRGGSQWVHGNLSAGDSVRVRGPRNHFHMDEKCRRIIFVAGGIGITPVSAMARRARALGLDYTLHYSGRSRASMPFLDDLRDLHGEQLHVYSGEEGQRNDIPALLATPEEGTQIYACGPVRMLQALESATSHWPAGALHIEHFVSTLQALDPSRENAFEIELRDSGLVLPVAADQTILMALRKANIDVQSDCEEGLCGSCEVRVVAGQIDHRDMVLTPSERAGQNRMMACCSRARGERIVLAL